MLTHLLPMPPYDRFGRVRSRQPSCIHFRHFKALAVPRSTLTDPPPFPILHHMAKFHGSQLDRTFAALVDPTRRAILSRLEQEASVSINELARPFAIKLPAVMKHLDVLGAAGLINRSKTGRTVAVSLAPEPMQEAMNWLRRYERFWPDRLDRLVAYAEAEEAKTGETTP